MEKYKPVSCNLYDELSNAALFKNMVVVTTIHGEIINGHIEDLFTREKEEFCIVENKCLRLDQIANLTVEGKNGLITSSDWSCSLK